ncbi:MAG: arginine repressor [Clostridia bacterium]|nr:arginine repressor [Clostridia bacterium]
MKNKRQGKILELISLHDIGTQEMLMEKLRDSGFDVTQATISRDIRELKLARVVTGKGSYKYLPPNVSESTVSVKFNGALTESIISVDSAVNIVVIKTYPGLAQAVATGIDAVENSMIVGCIAGDDTIMVVTRDEKSAAVVSQNIKKMIKTV